MDRRTFLQHAATIAAAMVYPSPPSGSQPCADNHETEAFWDKVRAQFPLRPDRVYFNTGGLGPSPQPVLDMLAQRMREVDETGETGHEVFGYARPIVAALVGADPEEIAFTRNATEGMNIIARGVLLRPGDEVLTTYHEHPGGALPWLAATRDVRASIRLLELPHNPGELTTVVERSLSPATRVMMMSHVPCTTGTIFPMRNLCELLRHRRVVSVVDGAQAAGVVPLSMHGIGCDFYTASGHKWLLGPKESGFVYIAAAAHEFFRPSFVGAYSDTRYDLDTLVLELRKSALVAEYGTRNAATIYGLLAALEFQNGIGWAKVYARQQELARRLIAGLQQIPNVEILTATEEGAYGGMVTFRAVDVPAAHLVATLHSKYAMRVRHITEHRLQACRISMHIFNSLSEVDSLIDAVGQIIKGNKK